jgi:hypothetical protein
VNTYGILEVNSDFTSKIDVGNNAILTGNGTITGDVTNSGILMPYNTKNPINKNNSLTIYGNYTHNPDAIFMVRANEKGQADRLYVTHGWFSGKQGIATLKGGTVSVLGDAGVYEKNMKYTILTADKIDGIFDRVETNLAFLDPSLSYDKKNVFLALTRNGRPYTEVAQTQNQTNIAHLFDKAQQDKDKLPVMDILDSLSIAGARRAYEQLDGSINTAVPTAGFSLFNRYMDVMKHRMQPFVTGTPSLSGADMSVLVSSSADMGSAMGNTLMSALEAANTTDRSTTPWGFFGKGYGG